MSRFFLKYENGRERVLTGTSFEYILDNYVLKTESLSYIINETIGIVLSGTLNGRL